MADYYDGKEIIKNQGYAPTAMRDERRRQRMEPWYEQAQAAIGGPLESREKQTVGAEGQMWQGVAQQQQRMGEAANTGAGFSAASARAADYAGGELESRGWGLANHMRALDEQQRRDRLMQLAQAKSQGELGQMQTDLNVYGEEQALNQWKLEQERAMTEAEAQAEMQAAATAAAIASGIVGTVGTIAVGGSDRRMKQDIERPSGADQDQWIRQAGETIGPQLDDAIRSSRGHKYEYRPDVVAIGLGGPGPRFGPMAQDLEKTPIGEVLVIDTPAGKVVDERAATMAALGMIGRLGERLDELEGQRIGPKRKHQ